MKLCAVGEDLRPTAKFAPAGKGSIPGLCRVVRRDDGGPTVLPAGAPESEGDYGELMLMYDRGRFTEAFKEGEDFCNVRARVLEGWARFVPSAEVLSEGVLARWRELRRTEPAQQRRHSTEHAWLPPQSTFLRRAFLFQCRDCH